MSATWHGNRLHLVAPVRLPEARCRKYRATLDLQLAVAERAAHVPIIKQSTYTMAIMLDYSIIIEAGKCRQPSRTVDVGGGVRHAAGDVRVPGRRHSKASHSSHVEVLSQ